MLINKTGAFVGWYIDCNNTLSSKIAEVALNDYKVISRILSMQNQWIYQRGRHLSRFSTDKNVFSVENVCNLLQGKGE